MNPVAFKVLGYDIRWYGVLIASGMVLGILVANYSCKAKNVDYDTFINTILVSLPIGIIGARLYYVLFEFNSYRNNFLDVFNIHEGGLAIHGGIIFGLLSALIYTRHKKINFFKIADVAAPSIILAQSIGRWGNYFNQEAHGGPVSYGFIKHFPHFIQQGMNIGGTYYQPTFLYESIWDFCVFLILISIIKKPGKNGLIFFTYVGLYSTGRFFIEGLRTDSLMLGPFRIAQLVSITGFFLWIILLLLYYRKRK